MIKFIILEVVADVSFGHFDAKAAGCSGTNEVSSHNFVSSVVQEPVSISTISIFPTTNVLGICMSP